MERAQEFGSVSKVALQAADPPYHSEDLTCPDPKCHDLSQFQTVAALGNHLIHQHSIPIAGRARKSPTAPLNSLLDDLSNNVRTVAKATGAKNEGKKKRRAQGDSKSKSDEE